MTILIDSVRPYHNLPDDLRDDVDAALKGFRAYLALLRPRMPRTAAVAQRPASAQVIDGGTLLGEVEGVQIAASGPANKRRNARGDVLAAIAECGPLTAGEIAEKLHLAPAWATTLMFRMHGVMLFVVGSKRNEKHYAVQVYHTDPAFAYVAPAPPKPADSIVEAKRPARIPSLAAVDRGLALIEKHFHADSSGKAVFGQLCRRSQSVLELVFALKTNDNSVRFALRRLIQIGVIEETGKEVTLDRTNRKHTRRVYAVVEAKE